MDRENKDFERDVDMAIAKEPKSQESNGNHNLKVTNAIKKVTSQHSKLLKKLAK